MLTLRVLDISQGGAAVLLPDDLPALAQGAQLGRVRLELDAYTVLEVALKVVHVGSANSQGRGTRLGCEMVGLSGEGARALQRYIDGTQRGRRLFTL